jgi:cation:H+ antiporter
MLDIFFNTIIFNIFVLIVSVFIIFKSAGYLILGISGYAKKLGLSDAIIGLLVISFVASMPDMIASTMGFYNDASIGVGTVLGCNISHIFLALGLLAIFSKKIYVAKSSFQKNKLLIWFLFVIPFLFLFIDGKISRFEGFLLILLFIFYIFILFRHEKKLGKVKEKVRIKFFWKDVVIFLLALCALILSGRFFVFSSIHLANAFSIPAYFISLTIISIGATVPDFAVELKSILKKHSHMGVGDLIGSVMIQVLLFFGIIAVIKPIEVDFFQILNALFFLFFGFSIFLFFMRKNFLNWKHGIFFLVGYFLFIFIEILKIV